MAITVPGYRIAELLGRGSYGEVWAARSADNGAQVALKLIRCETAAQARAARTEAALLAALDHPSLLRLVEYLPCDRFAVLVLELAEGGSLADLLRRRDRLSPAEVAATLSPVAAALAHAHEQNVLHCDVSSANILFTEHGRPKLADLGVARLFGDAAGLIGSPAYLDPTVAGGGPVGSASDVFSLAAVALHCLSGAGPWHRTPQDPAEQLITAAAVGLIADLPHRLAGCPPAMAAVVSRCLDPEPFRRGSAAEFALDLRASITPVPVALRAGRLSGPVGRHAAERLGAVDPTVPPGDGRPDFARPTFLEGGAVPADLTHVARPHVRAAIETADPRGRRGLRIRRALGRRAVQLGLAGSMIVVGTASLMTSGALSAGDQAAASASGSHTSSAGAGAPGLNQLSARAGAPGGNRSGAAAGAPGGTRAATAAGATVGSPAPIAVDDHAADVLTLLRRADAIRAKAYADRAPALLDTVYASPHLRRQDRAQLLALVPAGCRLGGVATDYSRPVVRSWQADRVEVRVTAAMGRARLSCPHRPATLIAGRGPTPVSVVLTRVGSDAFLIASQRVG